MHTVTAAVTKATVAVPNLINVKAQQQVLLRRPPFYGNGKAWYEVYGVALKRCIGGDKVKSDEESGKIIRRAEYQATKGNIESECQPAKQFVVPYIFSESTTKSINESRME